MKTSIISSKTLSEFATFCRDNELNVGVNITKDAMHLLGKKDINDLERIHDCVYVINTAAETHVDNSIDSSDSEIDSFDNNLAILETSRQKVHRHRYLANN